MRESFPQTIPSKRISRSLLGFQRIPQLHRMAGQGQGQGQVIHLFRKAYRGESITSEVEGCKGEASSVDLRDAVRIDPRRVRGAECRWRLSRQ